MATRKWLLAALGVVLVGLSTSTRAHEHEGPNDLDKVMYVTFTRPVGLPGVSLGSGTYIFELADPIGAWNVVRVSSRDRRVVYLTTFTRVVDRPHGMSRDQVISFGEAHPNSAQPIKTWWPTGESTGREFIY